MSIGLGDLNKKRAKAGKKTTAMNSVYIKSKVARPWSPTPAQKAPSKRPRRDVSDVAMNEESLFWFDLQQTSFLLQLNERLTRIENRVVEAVSAPLKGLRNFWFHQK